MAKFSEWLHSGYRSSGTPDAPTTVTIITTISGSTDDKQQLALRWLGAWFDRKLTLKRHVAERAAKCRRVSNDLRGLANIKDGPPPASIPNTIEKHSLLVRETLFVWAPGSLALLIDVNPQ